MNHQAAQTSVAVSTREPVRDADVNVIGSLELLGQCVRSKVQRVVYASTGGAVYGEVPEGERATVQRPPRPLSPYACSKFAVECYLRAYAHEHGLASTVLRYANVYGPRQDPHGEAGVVAIFTERLLSAQPIQVNARREVGDAGCVRDYVYVGDVVRYNCLAVDGAIAAPIVNVCTGEATNTLDAGARARRRRRNAPRTSAMAPAGRATSSARYWRPNSCRATRRRRSPRACARPSSGSRRAGRPARDDAIALGRCGHFHDGGGGAPVGLYHKLADVEGTERRSMTHTEQRRFPQPLAH